MSHLFPHLNPNTAQHCLWLSKEHHFTSPNLSTRLISATARRAATWRNWFSSCFQCSGHVVLENSWQSKALDTNTELCNNLTFQYAFHFPHKQLFWKTPDFNQISRSSLVTHLPSVIGTMALCWAWWLRVSAAAQLDTSQSHRHPLENLGRLRAKYEERSDKVSRDVYW